MTRTARSATVALSAALVIGLSASRANGQAATEPESFVDVSLVHASNTLWTPSTFDGTRFGVGARTSEHGGSRFEADIPSGWSQDRSGGRFRIVSLTGLYGYHVAPGGPVDLTLVVGGGATFMDRNAISFGTGEPYSETLFSPALVLGAEAAVHITRRLTIVPAVRRQEMGDGHRILSGTVGVRWTFTDASRPVVAPRTDRRLEICGTAPVRTESYTYLDSGRAGVAVERAISRHVAVRADLQGVFYGVGDGGAALGLRPTVGIVVPFGHYGSR